MSRAQPTRGERRSRRRRSPVRRRILTAVIVVAVLLVGLAAWVGVRAYLAKGELESALPVASRLQEQLVSGDVDDARASAQELADHAGAAASLTSDPIWRFAEVTPWVGPNLRVMREITAAADDVSRNGVVPLSELAGSIGVSSFKPVDGQIQLQPLIDSQATLADASQVVTAAAARVDAIDSTDAVQPLIDARTQLGTYLKEASSGLQIASDASRLLPSMLGNEQPRNYLVLFQNNAELRSTGGIPGAMAIVRADKGAVSLVQQASTTQFDTFPEPVVELPADTRTLYGPNTAKYIQDVNFTPYFPLSAQIAREMWSQRFGLQVDGVISLDPVALSYLLKATGPVQLATGDQLTSDNAVTLLLQDVYARYPDPVQQDAFFASAASAVFDKLAAGAVDPSALVSALAQASSENRVLIWSANDGEQQLLAKNRVTGELPVGSDKEQAFGLYFNDSTTAKMDPYLRVEIAAGSAVCRNDGLPINAIQVTLTNTAPADAATSLPKYVTGGGDFSIPEGNIRTNIAAYGAPGLFNVGVARDGERAPYQAAIDSGYGVSKVEVELAPGQSTVLAFQFLGADTTQREVSVRHTPFVYPLETTSLALDCADALQ
ncbi:DUF4012 domain-containing protein [Agreia pratensis]|uniref:DUF4012 domain-containing protein n=1 Tax=Agreia pratensis TaxID=150121 RepID=A0A1X7IN33_9MICO|nr:DUF4012 domain-containing protein [Agreia pratensis]SMG16058.1 Protein of unknown function [Agreia pratensis]